MGVMDNYIQISGVHKTFRTHSGPLQVLKGIDLTVHKGEIFGIIGFSGAGKSTLARCINRLEAPDSGSIKVGGVEILNLSKKQLLQERKKIGMIFQTFNLFEAKTVYHNISYPLEISRIPKSEIRKRVLETAELVGLSDKLNAYPGGLSGGQKQRVGIARALVNRPNLLLSDLLKEINRATGITILMITHELDAIRYTCDRMAVLEDGKIIEVGSVREIFSNPLSRTGALFAKVFTEFQRVTEYENGGGI